MLPKTELIVLKFRRRNKITIKKIKEHIQLNNETRPLILKLHFMKTSLKTLLLTE